MANTITIKNTKVSFSTMLNKLDKKLYGRMFKVLVPMDAPELAETIKQYKELNEKAKTVYGEKLKKKIKNAKSTDDVFAESLYKEGFVELKFNVYFVRTKEVTKEDGTKEEQLIEVLNPIYKTEDICYKIDNDGKKQYMANETKRWMPLSDSPVNITYSLVTGYSEKNNQPTIQLKAEGVELLEDPNRQPKSRNKYEFLTLSDENEEIENKVEQSVEPKVVPQKVEEATFTADELADLDI